MVCIEEKERAGSCRRCGSSSESKQIYADCSTAVFELHDSKRAETLHPCDKSVFCDYYRYLFYSCDVAFVVMLKDENGNYYAASQRSQLMLVATKPNSQQEQKMDEVLKNETILRYCVYTFCWE